MTINESTHIDAFRLEVREWLADHFPSSLAESPARQVVDIFGPDNTDPDFLLWKARMGAKGWSVPMWPRSYGGGGLSAIQAKVLADEMAQIGATNPVQGMGVNLLGPTLMEFGSEAQKLRHLPAVARGEVRWCQGYSEPGAGSDLASLQCQAEDQGDSFLVNGQKVWTSGAHFAHWCFCLVRTDRSRKQDGISFVLIDMRSPGVEARPITLIYGGSTFCEVFFRDVVVPKANLVGPLDGGWAVAKRLLQFERGGIGDARRARVARPMADIVRQYGTFGPDGRLADADLRARIAAHEIDARAVVLTNQRNASERQAGIDTGAATSILKNASIAAEQTRMELIIELLGHEGLGWDGETFSEEARESVRLWLRGKSGSIYGGTHEIQNNIIAKRILELPDPPRQR
jgi:alkylation response protein AidB-like acyl-CoA dehydrogenase